MELFTGGEYGIDDATLFAYTTMTMTIDTMKQIKAMPAVFKGSYNLKELRDEKAQHGHLDLAIGSGTCDAIAGRMDVLNILYEKDEETVTDDIAKMDKTFPSYSIWCAKGFNNSVQMLCAALGIKKLNFTGSWVAVFMCVRALLAFKAEALDAEQKVEFVKEFNAQLGLAPYRYKMYRLDNDMNIIRGVPAPGDE